MPMHLHNPNKLYQYIQLHMYLDMELDVLIQLVGIMKMHGHTKMPLVTETLATEIG